MQDLFHERNLWSKIQNKEFREVLLRERHANPLKSGQIFCTYSQILSYQDAEQNEVIRAHRYLKPDGKLGASAVPDPIWMFLNGVIYKLKAREQGD